MMAMQAEKCIIEFWSTVYLLFHFENYNIKSKDIMPVLPPHNQ
jgi:hypothetical protein